ncbi:MAG: glycosyltransferase [Frankiales bacterium]|nr:glycosyltransferase [Frankiales bacterium]
MTACSVVIPAHNEASCIEATLQALAGSGAWTLEITVVCNGCTDDTAARARAAGAQVVETEQAGKTHALNLGDQVATHFPRLYLDADILLTRPDAEALLAGLESRGWLAASPRPAYVLSGAAWLVRAFYAAGELTDYRREGMAGAGVAAVTAQGRARFGEWPDVIADDSFLRSQFLPDERGTVSESTAQVRPPSTVRGLIRASTRVRRGNMQLALLQRDAHPAEGVGRARQFNYLRRALGRPRLWPAVTVRVVLLLLIRLRAGATAPGRGSSAWGTAR